MILAAFVLLGEHKRSQDHVCESPEEVDKLLCMVTPKLDDPRPEPKRRTRPVRDTV